MKDRKADPATTVRFDTLPEYVEAKLIIRIPKEESLKFSSRGQVSVVGRVNDAELRGILEPDGFGGHWLAVREVLQQEVKLIETETVHVELTQIKTWPEPEIPKDFLKVLNASPKEIQDLWQEITPMARWEWVRWINETRNQATRKRRIEVSISKMESGKRRPCCFNLAACTDPDVSRRGRLVVDV